MGTVARLREKRPSLDHFIRAFSRYKADTGDRLAAAVTFFGFLSFFPLVALAFSILGFVLANNPEYIDKVTREISNAMPGLVKTDDNPNGIDVAAIASSRAGAGIAGLAGLLFAGLGWIDALREAVRSIWHQNVTAGNFVKKKLLDRKSVV